MHMKMRDALADTVVNCDKRSLRAKRFFHRDSEKAGVGEERLDPILGQIRQGFEVLFGRQQHVAREERPVVEERKTALVFKDDGSRYTPGDNTAEDTIRAHFPMMAAVDARGQRRGPAA